MKVLIMKISRWFKAWRKPVMNKAFNQLVREVAFTSNIKVEGCTRYDYFSFTINIHTNSGSYVDGDIDMIQNGVKIKIPLEKETIAVLKESIRRDK